MSDSAVRAARTAAEEWLFRQDAPEAVIVRAEVGADPDSGAAARWVRHILDVQAEDGSWSGDLLTTAKSLLTVRELREAGGLGDLDPGVGRGLAWVQGRRGIPGAWSDGCSPARHRLGLCHHFLGGFFSPSPPEVPPVDAVLRCGAEARGPGEARFLASVTALRCLLEWKGAPSTDGQLHLEGLRRVVRQWAREPVPGLGAASLLGAVRALLASQDAEDHSAAQAGLQAVAGRQRGDGSWVATDPFQALDLFLAAEAADVCSKLCHRALWHGARLLVSAQKADGTWGPEAGARRALIACRALRSVDPPG